MLAKAGYQVDIFLFSLDETAPDLPNRTLNGVPGIIIHSFQSAKKKPESDSSDRSRRMRAFPWLADAAKSFVSNWSVRGFRRILNYLLLFVRSDKGIIPKEILKLTNRAMQGGNYRALVGIEKGGLLWAATTAREHPAPLIYSSLELYMRAFLQRRILEHRRIKSLEEKYHKRCWATIIQDPVRGSVLLEDNQVRHNMRMLYVPISRMGGPVIERGHYFHDRLGIAKDQIVILSHGMIAEERFCVDLAQVAQSFQDSWLLVFHGWGPESARRKIEEIDAYKKVRFSLDLVELSEEPSVVTSANISLILYGKENKNDFLTGFASEKLALSLQCGIPVVAFNYPSFHHIREEGCGVLVNDLTEIPKAISEILADYANYRRQAFSTFSKYYNFEANFRKVLMALDELE
jgi:glycosyltransferase involved in cell wall biosynthesis